MKFKALSKLRGESVNEEEVLTPRGNDQVIKVLNDIVKSHSATKVKDQKTGKVILVDVQSANVVVKTYNSDFSGGSKIKMRTFHFMKQDSYQKCFSFS